MLLPWLTFIVVSLIVYAGFVKLAARLLRYKVSWKSTFFFAVIMLIIVMVVHVLDFRPPAAIRIGHGDIRLTALAFAMMVVVAFAMLVPVQALVR